jgi:glyoxylase-like metal-dependent hydrolase (beta-lactamase superfamily II)
LILKKLVVSIFQINCYILGCEQTHEGLVIDPGDNVEKIIKILKNYLVSFVYIVNTHAHIDHTKGNGKLKELTDAQILIHRADLNLLKNTPAYAYTFGISLHSSPEPDSLLSNGSRITLGEEISFQVIHTPSYSPGGVSFFMDTVVFVGNTFFDHSIGRTDLWEGSDKVLLHSITSRLFPLGDVGEGISCTRSRNNYGKREEI